MRSSSLLLVAPLLLVALCVGAEQPSDLVKNATAGGRYYGEGGNDNYQSGGGDYKPSKGRYGSSPAPSLVDEYVCDLEATILVVASKDKEETNKGYGSKSNYGGDRPSASPNAVRLKCSHIATRSEEDCQQCCQLAARADHSVSRHDINGFIINADQIDHEDYKRQKRQVAYQGVAPTTNYDNGANTYTQPAQPTGYQQQPTYGAAAPPTIGTYDQSSVGYSQQPTGESYQQQQPTYGAAAPPPSAGYTGYQQPQQQQQQQSYVQPPTNYQQQSSTGFQQQQPSGGYEQQPSAGFQQQQQPKSYAQHPAQTSSSYGYPAPSSTYAAAPGAPESPSSSEYKAPSKAIYSSAYTYEFYGVPRNRRCVCCAPKRYDNAPADYRRQPEAPPSRRYRQRGQEQSQY